MIAGASCRRRAGAPAALVHPRDNEPPAQGAAGFGISMGTAHAYVHAVVTLLTRLDAGPDRGPAGRQPVPPARRDPPPSATGSATASPATWASTHIA